MNAYAYQELITEGIKDLPTELLREVADFVYLLRKRMQDPQAFAEEQRNFLLAAELTQLSRDEDRHLEEEFADYEQRFLMRKGDGLMSAMEDDTFDYQAWMRETPPDPAKIHRGTADRQRRFAAAMLRRAVRIDEDLLNQFHQLAAEGQSSEQLINQALREWLAARGMREMVRAEIQLAVRQSLSATQTHTESPQA